MKRVTSYLLLLLLSAFVACSQEPVEKPDPEPDPDPQPETEQHLVITHSNVTMQVPELSGKGMEAWVMWNTGMEWLDYQAGMTYTYSVSAPYLLEIKGTEIEEVYVPQMKDISVLDFRNF